MRQLSIFFVHGSLIVLFAWVATLNARPNSPELSTAPPAGRIVTDLRSPDPGDRFAAKRDLLQFRQQLVDDLLELASEDKERYEINDSRYLAVELLPQLGAREAIPLFAANVEYAQPMPVTGFSRLNGYPCALALRQFGQTGTQGILVYLMQRPKATDKAIELYAWLFIEVYGTNAGGFKEAIRVVEGATGRALHKEGLQRLLDKIREITKDRVSPFE